MQFSSSVVLRNVIDRLPALNSFNPVSLSVPCVLSRFRRSDFEMFGAQWSATKSGLAASGATRLSLGGVVFMFHISST